jgi:hypothetical protein
MASREGFGATGSKESRTRPPESGLVFTLLGASSGEEPAREVAHAAGRMRHPRRATRVNAKVRLMPPSMPHLPDLLYPACATPECELGERGGEVAHDHGSPEVGVFGPSNEAK